MNEASWKRLIDKIRENNVVPIIGPRLLVEPDGTSFQARVAERVLEACGEPLGDRPLLSFREVNDAVSRLRGRSDIGLQDLYDVVNDAIRESTADPRFAIPEPIRQLAEIDGFRLFVTLTPDDLLARGLRQHHEVNEIVHAPNLPSSEMKDLPLDWQARSDVVHLLYLFGKSRSAPMFAIHDEDVLEYAHNVIAHGSQVPANFLRELQQRNLLLIGSDFPDWLSRFFLRATNLKRLAEKDMRAWLIEPLQPEESLTFFLRCFSKETEIISQDTPAQFVAELHKRWMAQAETEAAAPETDSGEPVPRGAMFFISYSRRTDLPRARALYDALLALGVDKREIWFDRQSIEPGDRFRKRILEGILGCRYFLPLLSTEANERDEGFVFREWRAASDRQMAMNREFLIPVVVDAEYAPERYSFAMEEDWRDLDFGHAPGGLPDEKLRKKLIALVREARKDVDIRERHVAAAAYVT